jgi:hypothetical protein
MVMVPVLDSNKVPLMPCTGKRARLLMERGQAIPYWQKGIFCIRLIKEPSARKYQPVALGVDPGSMREGYTVSTEKADVLNITTNTPDWVKKHVETRRLLRRARRQRKTPYRASRLNRSSLRKNRVPPSTKARWGAKLRIIKRLLKILPITIINVEDISAITKEGKKRWNQSFSPLEVGKSWFYSEIEKLKIILIKTKGYDTYSHRINRGFPKSEDKKADIWESHNSDSHCLCEIALNKNIEPYKGIYRIDFLKHHRRQLHVQNPTKGNIRRRDGSTVSMGMSRGSVLLYKNKLVYLGGTAKGRVSIHSIITGKRINKYIKVKDIKIMYNTKQRVQFLPRLKSWVSLHNFS